MAEKQVIPIFTLSGGVSRQPATKRTPFQAEDLDNCLVSLERSIEKRPGFSVLSGVGEYNLSFLPTTADPHFTWYQLDRQNRYLIIVDRNATGRTDKLFYVVKVLDNSWTNQTPDTQWDPDDPLLVWDGDDAIVPGDPRYLIYSQTLNKPAYDSLLARGVVNIDTRGYITAGTGKVREVLKTLQIGTYILFLNTKVYAGFTSGTSGKTVSYSGTETETDDTVGGKITYYTSLRVKKTTDGRLYPSTYTLNAEEDWDTNWGDAKFIPVEDYVYGDFEKPWLGQSVRNFGDLRFPPDSNDWVANNSNNDLSPADDGARDMLREVYDPKTAYFDEGTDSSPADGRGKIYYCDAPYLSLDAGYYRIVSFPEDDIYSGTQGLGKPYTQKVRTPDYCSVLDKKRMPQKLNFLNGIFNFAPIEWTPRTVGDRTTNPGPSPFLTEDGEARHVQISSICNFRDRLFFSSGDVVFSSQMGVLEDLWIKDPSNVGVADPIDVRAASNSYAEITAMVPFDIYLFINTKGGVQFELKGESNLISPLTAEISSTTFYSTADLVDPQTLGSQIYFLDKQRLYIYLNQESRQFNTAVELSNIVRGYLPTNYQDATTAVSQNYILAVDEDAKNNIYIYCNRFDGDQLIQSAFWKYILNSLDAVYGLKVWDNYLYCVSKRENDSASAWYILKNYLEQEEATVPRLDSLARLEITNTNVTAQGVETTLTVPYMLPSGDCYVVLADGFEGDNLYSVYPVSENIPTGNQTVLVFSGIDLTEHYGKFIYVGSPFTMRVKLSPQFLRDNANNIIEGTLNLKTLTVRHAKTGTYRVEVSRRGRTNKLISEYSATNLENTNYISEDGIFVAKIFGFADQTEVEIINDKIAPCNITQLEFKAVFNRNNSSLR